MNFSLLQNELRPVRNEEEYFYTKRTEDIMPPCTMERSNELCFYCLEGGNCTEHPLRKVIAMGIACFADDDFDLVEEDTICHLFQFPDEKSESVEDADIQCPPSSPKCSLSAQQNQMDPQLASHNGFFSLMLQRMVLEAHAASGTLSLTPFPTPLPHHKEYLHTVPTIRQNIPFPPKTFGSTDIVSDSSHITMDDKNLRAKKKINLEMKISLLKKRREEAAEIEEQEDDLIVVEDTEPEVGGVANIGAVVEVGGVSDIGRVEVDDVEVDVVGEISAAPSESVDRGKKNKEISEIFKSPNAADLHFKRMHKKPVARAPLDCEECGKRFASAFQLKEHISIQHLKERNFVCEECGQKFGRRGGLRRHVQMVHMNHMHKCPYADCDHPGYKCSKALTAHIRSVHTNVRPYVCETCSKAFVRRNDLKMHTLTHTRDVSFECDCGSKFRRHIYLKKHQRSCPSAAVLRNDDASDSRENADELVGEERDDSD
uniref:Protein krueppel n=1 Tax=Heterorhabditis bacteriophora TaxID=37862 RepID=A0A1I7XAV3_HETBA